MYTYSTITQVPYRELQSRVWVPRQHILDKSLTNGIARKAHLHLVGEVGILFLTLFLILFLILFLTLCLTLLQS